MSGQKAEISDCFPREWLHFSYRLRTFLRLQFSRNRLFHFKTGTNAGDGERRNLSWKQRRETDLPVRLLSSGHSLQLPYRKSQNWVISLVPRQNAMSKSMNLLLKYREAAWEGRCSEEKIPCPVEISVDLCREDSLSVARSNQSISVPDRLCCWNDWTVAVLNQSSLIPSAKGCSPTFTTLGDETSFWGHVS